MSENKKPRIAEILGVEVGEAFSIDGYPTDYGMVQVCEDGKIRRRCLKEIREVTQLEVGHKIGSNALYYLLNHPERIIRKPRWTEQEVEDAKAIRRIMSEYTDIARGEGRCGTRLFLTSEDVENYTLDPELFPSLRPGETVTLNEIISSIHDGEGGQSEEG